METSGSFEKSISFNLPGMIGNKIILLLMRNRKILVLVSALVIGPFNEPGRPSCSIEQYGRALMQTREITIQNLLTAYTGETTACAKYAAFAWKAKKEGYNSIALLFSAVSNSEHIHARQHKGVLLASGVTIPDVKPRFNMKSTLENLKDAISGESREVAETYPEFMAVASNERNQKALESFNHAYKAEIKHKSFFEEAITALLSNNLKQLPSIYSVCQVCGNTYNTRPPERCAICSSPTGKFLEVYQF
jgi:rubrerythrin